MKRHSGFQVRTTDTDDRCWCTDNLQAAGSRLLMNLRTSKDGKLMIYERIASEYEYDYV